MAQKDTDARAISVKTLDLDCDFLEVRKQLDDISHSCFGTEQQKIERGMDHEEADYYL